MPKLSVRLRVDFGATCAIGPGKIALLEAIGRTGSLSQAARDLAMSYRRAWLLLDSLNTSFARPVADMATGGRGGGGATLTPFGKTLSSVYRKFEADVGRRAATQFAAIVSEAAESAPATVARRRLTKAAPATTKRRARRA